MYTLYYSPGACSLAVHMLLIEVAAQYRLVRADITTGGNRTPEFLKLNPRGQVPVLLEGDWALRESAVMAVYLADKYKSPLLPPSGHERFKALEWLGFYNSSLHQAYGSYFLLSKNLKEDAARRAACALAAKRIGYLWREVETHLAANRYLCGETLTLADIFHATMANWTPALADEVALGPNIRRLCGEIAALPSFKRALEEEHIHYRIA